MVLSRRSRLARFAYFGPFGPMPRQTSLCAFFWRTFVFVPIFCAVVAALVGTLAVLIAGVVWNHRRLWPYAAFFVSLIVVISLSIIYEDEIEAWHERHPRFGVPTPLFSAGTHALDAVRDSFFVQGLKTLKGKLCPIIELRAEQPEPPTR